MAEAQKKELKAGLETGPGKSLWPLQWIYRINIMGFHPFPYVFMLLLLAAVVPLVLYSIGVPFFQLTQIPIVKDILAYLGVFNDRDAFVWGTWIVWWPAFIMTILVFRRIWCGGFCPFGLITDMGSIFGKWLRNGKEAKPININSYVYMGFTTFLVIGYLHDALNITNSVMISIEFVLFFFFFAFITGVMLPRRTFCRSFCFVGVLPHLFGRLAFLGLKTDRNKCVDCKGQWCVTSTNTAPIGIAKLRAPLINVDGCPMYINVPQLGHEESNRHCILCGNCIKNCPYDAIHYQYLTPGYEVIKGIQLNGYETYFTLGIAAVLSMFVAMEGGFLMNWGNWVLKTFQFTSIKDQWAIVGSFVILASVIIGVFYVFACSLTASILRLDVKRCLKYFGYAYLPFTYLMFFRDIFVVYLVDGSILQVWLGRGPQWFMTIVPFIEIFLMVVGAVWSMALAWRLVQVAWIHQNPNQPIYWQEVMSGALPHIVLTFGFFWFWITNLDHDLYQRITMVGIAPWLSFVPPISFLLLVWIFRQMNWIRPYDWDEQQTQKATEAP